MVILTTGGELTERAKVPVVEVLKGLVMRKIWEIDGKNMGKIWDEMGYHGKVWKNMGKICTLWFLLT